MHIQREIWWGVLLAGLFSVWSSAQENPFESAENAPLPKYADMTLPEAEALLREKPVDWVVLRNDDTLIVEPLTPRPNTLIKMDEELKRLTTIKPKNKEEADEIKLKRQSLQKLQVTLIHGGDDPDFVVDVKHIKEIIHHEDLVLKRASRCIDNGLTALAFELLVYLDRRSHNWPGYAVQTHRLLFKEAQFRLEQNDPEACLRFSEELFQKDPGFSGLSKLAGEAVQRLSLQAAEQQDYRRVRHFLGRLTNYVPDHPVANQWKADLTSRTTEQIAAARSAAQQQDLSQAWQLINAATRIWPETPGLKEAHRELTNRYPVLSVGVLDLVTDDIPYQFPTWAQQRSNQLTTLKWFETVRYDENGPRYASVPCESWEPDDLGRELRFTMRRERAEWESRPLMTSATLAAALAEQLNPVSARYSERLASYVAEFATPTPYELQIRFRRPPLRPEAFFRLALTPAAEVPELNADLTADLAGFEQRFRLSHADHATCQFVRVRPEPETVKQKHVAEVVERSYADWSLLLQGLMRGEISVLPRIKHQDLAALRDDPRFFVVPYAQPVSHLIQFNPQSPPLKNGQLRRALLHALPRENMLQNQILPGGPKEQTWGRLIASPFTLGSAASNRLLPQVAQETILSAGLASTARKELGGQIPPLRITFPPDVEIRQAVDEMILQWKRVGIEVQPVTRREESWDLAYRTVQFREPLMDLWPFLTNDPTTSVASLNVFPERIRRQLMEMERAADWSSAMRVLHRLQTDLLIDAWWIPLWEIDEFCLIRRNITGLPEKFVNPYQDVERWVVQSWYPTEQP